MEPVDREADRRRWASCVDREAEERYLGGAMIDPRVLSRYPLANGAFGIRINAHVHQAMLGIAVKEQDLTEERLNQELDALGHYEAMHARPFQLARLMTDDPEALCEHLRSLAVRRDLLRGVDAARAALASGQSILACQTQLAKLAHLEVANEDRTKPQRLAVAAEAAAEATLRAASGDVDMVEVGLPALHRHTGGWDRGDVGIIAGDSGAGKSSTMLAMARKQENQGERVLIVTHEDGELRWGRRAVHSASGVAVRALKLGDLTGGQWADFDQARATLERENIWLASPLGGTLDEAMHAVRRARVEHGVTVVYIDYLQAISMPKGAEMRHHLRDCMEACRRETRTGLTFILGSQYKKRLDETKRPSNGDLYEANYLWQKSDFIVHLWRDGEGNRHWWLGKHKSAEPIAGRLLREEHTGYLADRRAS